MIRLDFSEGTLRSFARGDIEALATHGNNPNVAAQLMDRWPIPYTTSHAREWLDGVVGQEPERHLAIEVDKQLVGGLGAELGTDVYRGSAEIGYWLAEPFWGRGIMTGAVDCFSTWIADRFKLRRVQARVFDSNPASRRVLEKAGFLFEGTMSGSAIKLGEVLDVHVYGRLVSKSAGS